MTDFEFHDWNPGAKMSDRPPIPEDMRRLTRQRCGFGCVICGKPFYQVDHIVDYAIVKQHTVDNLTLLCDYHHPGKTHGRVSKASVIKANANPFNASRGYTTPVDAWIFDEGVPAVGLGTNKFTSLTQPLIPVVIDDRPILSFRNSSDQLLFSIDVRDRHDKRILEITDNELIFTTSAWDVKLVGSRVTMRNAPGQIMFDMYVDTDSHFVNITKATLFYHGVSLLASTQNLQVGGFTAEQSTFESSVGIAIGHSPLHAPRAAFKQRRVERTNPLFTYNY